ncbi:MAG: hypothetical protein MUP92_04275, partial [Actinobacteria bacterium]|nr:hypothetical protein [Actinomycetota bacterium]
FTMAELVVAMVIITIALLVLMMVQTSALVTIAEANKRQQATAYGNEAMEQMRALPWNVLKKGMANNFVSASGGDPNVSGGVLTLEGISEDLNIAPPAGDPGAQDLSDPWPPLFSETGSNLQVERTPGNTDIEYEVRTYVVEGLGGEGTIGMVVHLKWLNIDSGETGEQVLRSTAYAPLGGCGDLDKQPFLSSCEARFESAAGSGNLVVSASSSKSEIVGTETIWSPYPIIPGSAVYQAYFQTSGTRATMSSQQTALLEATGAYGGLETVGSDGTNLSTTGFGQYSVLYDSSPLAGEPPDMLEISQNLPNSLFRSNPTSPGFSLTLSPDADDDGGRHLTMDAGGINSPITGIPADQAWALAEIDPGDPTGVMWNCGMGDPANNQNLLYPYYRVGSNAEGSAWAARFVEATGTSDTGCTTVTGAGCASAGAQQESDEIHFGYPYGGNTWTNGVVSGATEGIVYIYEYWDEAIVDRGPSQTSDSVVSIERGGHLHYWNGSGYSAAIELDEGLSEYLDITEIPDLSWTSINGKVNVVASTTVTIGPAQLVSSGDCIDEACMLTATAGTISVRITYTVTLIEYGLEYSTTVTGTLNGSTAIALYKAAPSG